MDDYKPTKKDWDSYYKWRDNVHQPNASYILTAVRDIFIVLAVLSLVYGVLA